MYWFKQKIPQGGSSVKEFVPPFLLGWAGEVL
jgi:hypothetical protein